VKAPNFAEVEARVRDAERVREIAADERRRFEMQFEPAKKAAAENIKRMNNLRGHLAPW